MLTVELDATSRYGTGKFVYQTGLRLLLRVEEQGVLCVYFTWVL